MPWRKATGLPLRLDDRSRATIKFCRLYMSVMAFVQVGVNRLFRRRSGGKIC